MKRLVLNIDDTLHKDFKKVAAESEDSMTAVLIKCIKEYLLDKNKKVIY